MRIIYTLLILLTVIFTTIESSGIRRKLKTKTSASEPGDDSSDLLGTPRLQIGSRPSDVLATPRLPKKERVRAGRRPAQLQIRSRPSYKEHLELFQKYCRKQYGENSTESSGVVSKLKTKPSSSKERDDNCDVLSTPDLLQIESRLSEEEHLNLFQKYFKIQPGENIYEFCSQSSPASPQELPPPPSESTPQSTSLFTTDNLQDIRLIPNKNPNRVFEIKEHVFPQGVQLELKLGVHRFVPLPNRVQRVLITTDGVVYAIIYHYNLLRGIYKPQALGGARAKMNILTRYVEEMTKKEAEEVPLGKDNLITDNFTIEGLPPCN